MFTGSYQGTQRPDTATQGRRQGSARRAPLTAALALGALCVTTLVLPQAALAAAKAPAVAVTFTQLKLVNGWQNAPFSTSKAAAADVSGIIYLKGAVDTSGTNPVMFVLPPAFRPAARIHVPVDLCGANAGRLFIDTNGLVSAGSEGSWSNAQCFTSLDGVSFAKSGVSFTTLQLRNGWQDFGHSFARAQATIKSGIVHLRGAIATTGVNQVAFILPASFRPATKVYAAITLDGAQHGRLIIQPDGVATVYAEFSWSGAQGDTSLDGVSFATSQKSFTALALRNGWQNYGSGTARATVSGNSGIVRFRGAISTGGSNPVAFTLPASLRPATNVYVPVDLCNANNGRLWIRPNGVVTVQAEGNTFSHAACFTSLDGAWFAR